MTSARKPPSSFPWSSRALDWLFWKKYETHAARRPSPAKGVHPVFFNPFLNLYAALTRSSAGGRVIGAAERIGVAEALTAMTANGAYASFDEATRGTLEPGMAADVAVLSGDVFAIEPAAILETRADLTILAGQIVHDRLRETAG